MRVGYLDPSGAYVEEDDGKPARKPKGKSSGVDDGAPKKPWLEFRYGKDAEPLGYFWGPSHDRSPGQRAHFGVGP